ncbi:MAG: HYR domain-containing protein [Verrucomicrobiae bacterium]|nr:HYR domain-containing protein [Verrucomicrobiae bacterium]
MKRIVAGLGVMACLSFSGVRGQNIDNPPIQGECLTWRCEVVDCPDGSMTFGELVIWPESPLCLGTTISASPNMDATCGEAVALGYWVPFTTNCPPPAFYTNACSYPGSVTNWWVVNHPGFSASGEGLGVQFTPTNCGSGTISFYNVWTNVSPCDGHGGYGGCGGGFIAVSRDFTVLNVEIAEPHKFTCACETVSYTLTNTCGEVTWEVWPEDPGGPRAVGSSIVAGTNCGTWTVSARSVENPNCAAAATLTVVTVAGLWPDAGTQVAEDPPTYVICPVPANDPNPWITVTASSCPGLEETNLPACWELSGGVGAGRLERKVDRRQLGTTTITATAGCSSQTVMIRVEDTEAPVISCPGDFGVCTDAGQCYATVDLNAYVSASDNCGPVTVTFSPAGPQFAKGTTPVTATATDLAGNTAQCTFSVTVEDCEPPTIQCPGNVTTTNDPGQCYATGVALGTPVTWDNCGVASVFNNAPAQFPVGTTLVTWTVRDTEGFTATCVQVVQVNDTEPPGITCASNLVVCASASGSNIVTWPTPVATDNCSVASVTCDPPSGSWFAIGVSEVTCTAVDASGNSNSCTFTVSVVKLDVTNIKFNHDTSSSVSDAINLRQDFATPYDISNGEWIQGGANLPVCYTASKAVTIRVRLTVQPASVTSADVWAASTDLDGSLGDIVNTTVTFASGVSSPEYVTFTVSGNTPATIKKTATDVWQWKMENLNGTGSSACDLNTSGPHTVYTILADPVAPWDNTAGSHYNAWSSALEVVCDVTPWAGGTATMETAATRIVESIYGSGRFSYDTTYGAAHYLAAGNVVEFTECLDRLGGGIGLGSLINCTDCANFVTAFVNLIGGGLYSSRMGFNFLTNPYSAIGRASWTPPSWGWGFSYHEVGWTAACGDSDTVFDACLKVDGDGDPSAPPRSERTPANMIFSDGDQNAPYVYRESLASPGAPGYGSCVSQPATRVRRMIR